MGKVRIACYRDGKGEGGWPAHDSFDTIARYPFTAFPVCLQTLAIYSVWLFSLQIKIEHGLLKRVQESSFQVLDATTSSSRRLIYSVRNIVPFFKA